MIAGGIPKVVNEYTKTRQISLNTYNVYIDAIKGDINSLNKNNTYFRQIATSIVDRLGWTTSWKSLQSGTDIGSHNTISDYVNALNEMFVVLMLYQYNVKKKGPIYDRDKKIYFRDPFYLHAINGIIDKGNPFYVSLSLHNDESKQGILVEEIMADHLTRLAFALTEKKQSFEYSEHIFYWKYEKNEIDFVLNNGIDIELPIEVKFQNSINSRDLDSVINFKRESKNKNQFPLLLSKNKFDILDECVVIPASVFLMLV
jgi:predicted AAA+ superfamily ATPase